MIVPEPVHLLENTIAPFYRSTVAPLRRNAFAPF
jgi:hypothetical protein